MKRQKLSLTQVMDMFPNDRVAEEWFTTSRWPDGVRCPFCHGDKLTERKPKRYRSWRCRPCGTNFSAKTKSLMHSSNLGFRLWCIAMYQVTTNLKGIASTKLASDLKIAQHNAWHMIHRIRAAYDHTQTLQGPVEADETFIGGIERNKHESMQLKQGRGNIGKQAVVGVKSRKSNNVQAVLVNTVSATTLQRTVRDRVESGALVYTDQHGGYVGLAKQGYQHKSVNHSAKEYVNGMSHTNGIESFWALLKRGYYGTYHKMSVKHLQRYVNEFAGRHNDRSKDTPDQLLRMAHGFDGKTLRYRDLIS